ncbi:MAG: SurA N-terminal domain-containing protein [Acidobacteria bacterium]|nr:SurA N-terminal domain-containing protein [Acidobacteriota bacterium]
MRSVVIACLVLCLSACVRDPGADAAARVNGYRITHAELEKYYQSQVTDSGGDATPDQERMMRLNLLGELIDRQIMLDRAEKLGLMAVDDEVESSFQQYGSRFRDAAEFDRHLEERGVTVEVIKADLRRTLTIEKLLHSQITSRVVVTEPEMRAYYDKNLGSFNVPEQQVHLAWILVTARSETPVPNLQNDDATDAATAKKKIEMLEARLRDGGEFATLAQNYSEDPVSTASGGDLGFIPQSSLEQVDLTLRRVVASLSAGDVSPIIQTGDEYRIIKILSIEQAGQRDYSDPRVQQTIRETIRGRKEQLLRAAYLEVARNEAEIDNYMARTVIVDFGISD